VVDTDVPFVESDQAGGLIHELVCFSQAVLQPLYHWIDYKICKYFINVFEDTE